jgi:penicillin-binding protein 1A
MNYGKKGVRARQKALNSKSAKWGRRIILTGLRAILVLLVVGGVMGVAAGIGIFKGIIASAPQIDVDQLAPLGQSTLIYDAEGNEIDKYVSSDSNRIIITSMDQIPENLAHAFVALEDERFYVHNGVDVKGMVRAGYQFLASGGKIRQGASTITQQLLKNMIFLDWMSEDGNLIKMIKRKIQEQYLAIELTKESTKDEVLLQYLNVINLSQNTLGVEAASQRYFGKSCSDLTLSECAVIAGITNSPTKYNPILHPDNNAERRLKCLNDMLEQGWITQQEYDIAMADTDAVYQRVSLHEDLFQNSNDEQGSYFSDALRNQVLDDMVAAGYTETIASTMLNSGGLRIYSTQDPKIQAIVDAEVANPEHFPEVVKWYLNYALTITSSNGSSANYSKENMMTYFQENVDRNFNLIFDSQEAALEAIETYRGTLMLPGDTYKETVSMTPQPQVSITIMDQNTGYVVAMVGGRGTKTGRLTLNRASATVRQPGSTFKVLAAYAPALDSAGLSLAYVLDDAPFNYPNGRPVNNWYDTGYRGINPLREGIVQSMNVLTVKLFTQITPQLGFEYLQNFGFTTLVQSRQVGNQIFSDIAPATALGGITDGVTNMELCAAYASIANQGGYQAPKLYSKVVDYEGNIILDNTAPQSRQVLKETTAFLLTSAMQDAVVSGTGGGANFSGMNIAGKTGTTTDTRDTWFVGYTPYYTCASWVGYDNNLKLNTSTRAGVNESNIAKKLWKAVMSQIHEELPNEPFHIPEGIVQKTICTRSGKLPIPGLCDATQKVEYFALGTEPTETCDIHYEGPVCRFDVVAASEFCPFAAQGIIELPLIEDPSLYSGYPLDAAYQTSKQCQHNAEFFMNPDAQMIIAQQTIELAARDAAAGIIPPGEQNDTPIE